jgi:hypothetical protein
VSIDYLPSSIDCFSDYNGVVANKSVGNRFVGRVFVGIVDSIAGTQR